MAIHTVLGSIEPEELGLTSMHEHLYLDASILYRQTEGAPAEDRVTMATLGWLRWNLLGMRDNLVVDDDRVILEGLSAFRAAGGRGIVDMTNIGLGRRVADLPALARAAGVHVMVGCGWYRDGAHPAYVATSPVEALAEMLVDELANGIDDTGVRPVLIGEVGTSEPMTDGERKALAASGRACAATGAAVNVHVEAAGRNGVEIVDILQRNGADPARIILSHLDERLDLDHHLELAALGVVLEYDTFGMEAYWDFPAKDPTDVERFEHLARLLDHGLEDRITLGCDVFCKTAHTAYGGLGYEHLPARVVTSLREHYRVTDDQLHKLLVANPRRLLNR